MRHEHDRARKRDRMIVLQKSRNTATKYEEDMATADSTFSRFSDLPVEIQEIQEIIWRFCLPGASMRVTCAQSRYRRASEITPGFVEESPVLEIGEK